MAAPVPILTYFNSRGLAEVIRLIFVEVGQAFDDRRIDADEWAELKPTLPFQQLPLLQIDGVDMVQSTAISRYLGARSARGSLVSCSFSSDHWSLQFLMLCIVEVAAKKYDLYGHDSIEQYRIDMCIDGAVDLRNRYMEVLYLPEDRRVRTSSTVCPDWTSVHLPCISLVICD
jgi:hypothetical protein